MDATRASTSPASATKVTSRSSGASSPIVGGDCSADIPERATPAPCTVWGDEGDLEIFKSRPKLPAVGRRDKRVFAVEVAFGALHTLRYLAHFPLLSL